MWLVHLYAVIVALEVGWRKYYYSKALRLASVKTLILVLLRAMGL